MKLAIIGDYPLSNPYGGVQTHIYHLTEHLSNIEELEVHVITFSDENFTENNNKLFIHHIKRFNKIPRLFTISIDTRAVKKKVREINPDIVHVQGTHYPYSYIAGQISSSYPTILTVHGLISREYKFYRGLNFFGGFLSFILEKYAFKKIKNIIVCSLPMRAEVKKLSKAKINLIPNGIELDEIQSFKPSKLVKNPSIIYLGLLEDIKGIDVLIKATKIVKEEMPDIVVYVAGTGSKEDSVKQLSKDLNLDETIKFLGYLDDIEKFSYLKSADICVVPSRYESFGIVILEAMASRTPVIASKVGNIPFLLEGYKELLVNPDDPEDLARTIIKLINNNELMEYFSLNTIEEVKKYDWNIIARKSIDLYKNILCKEI